MWVLMGGQCCTGSRSPFSSWYIWIPPPDSAMSPYAARAARAIGFCWLLIGSGPCPAPCCPEIIPLSAAPARSCTGRLGCSGKIPLSRLLCGGPESVISPNTARAARVVRLCWLLFGSGPCSAPCCPEIIPLTAAPARSCTGRLGCLAKIPLSRLSYSRFWGLVVPSDSIQPDTIPLSMALSRFVDSCCPLSSPMFSSSRSCTGRSDGLCAAPHSRVLAGAGVGPALARLLAPNSGSGLHRLVAKIPSRCGPGFRGAALLLRD